MDRRAYLELNELEGRHWWFVARRQILADVLMRRGAIPPHARILEAGCGCGGNLDMLGAFGTVSAFEMDDQARQIARSRTSVSIAEGQLPDRNPFRGQEFDLIAMLDVLEHIEDDAGALVELERCLAPGGQILLSVPAYPWLWSGHDEMHHHHRRYTKRSLVDVLTRAGFEINYITYFNSILLPLAVGARLMAKHSQGTSLPGATTNGLLRGIFASERLWLRQGTLPFGLSLLALAGRSAESGSHVRLKKSA
jgi:SAM-dependent methyltransferase